MIDTTQLIPEVLEAVRQNLGVEAEDDSKDTEIAAMSPIDVFDRYLCWEGLIGFSGEIWESVDSIKKASDSEPKEE